jgi:hypothetical protein
MVFEEGSKDNGGRRQGHYKGGPESPLSGTV